MQVPTDLSEGNPTRFIAIGPAPLVEGFGLIGFETYPDKGPEELEVLLKEILQSRNPALLLLENRLARCPSPILENIRNQQVHIVVVEIPELHDPKDFHPEVERLVISVLGASALESKT